MQEQAQREPNYAHTACPPEHRVGENAHAQYRTCSLYYAATILDEKEGHFHGLAILFLTGRSLSALDSQNCIEVCGDWKYVCASAIKMQEAAVIKHLAPELAVALRITNTFVLLKQEINSGLTERFPSYVSYLNS